MFRKPSINRKNNQKDDEDKEYEKAQIANKHILLNVKTNYVSKFPYSSCRQTGKTSTKQYFSITGYC